MTTRVFFLLLILLAVVHASAQKQFLFIGTYSGTGSKGIYVYEFDAATGKAKWLSNTDSVINPSFLAIHPRGDLVYACTETKTVNAGGISAFSFDKKNAKLTLINKQSSGGDNPAYVTIDKTGQWVIAGNYSGGSLAAFQVKEDGGIAPYAQLVQHHGNSIDKARQEKAHVHATVFAPNQDFVFTPDLGMDKVMVYRFDAAAQKPLQEGKPPYAETTPGGGPRHFEFHPNGKWAYLAEEMAGAVQAYDYKKGKLKRKQRIATHPDSLTSGFSSADIHTSPDGKFLYVSNRGKENNIAIFSIHQKTGELTAVGYQSTLGLIPRNFCIDLTGNYLLAANQESGNIVIFKRDKQTGLLNYTGEQINIPKPVCLKMLWY